MAKKLREIVESTHDMLYHAAHQFYSDAYPDLPRQGDHHYIAAQDYIADRLSDKFRALHPTANFRRIASRYAKKNIHDDRYESRLNDAKEKRRAAARIRPKAQKSKPAKRWDDYRPFYKTVRGTGSY